VSAHGRVVDLIEIILHAVAEETGVMQDQLSVELESVVTRGVLEAFKRGSEDAHEHPTDPSILKQSSRGLQRTTPPKPTPAVHPHAAPTRKMPTPYPRARVPTPMPKIRDRRRDPKDD
jgi:hypothetical protein